MRKKITKTTMPIRRARNENRDHWRGRTSDEIVFGGRDPQGAKLQELVKSAGGNARGAGSFVNPRFGSDREHVYLFICGDYTSAESVVG